MGYIRELDRSPSNCSEESNEKIIKTTGDNYEDCNWMHSLKKDRTPQKKPNLLDKKYFFRMKNTATDILIRKIANEKSLDNINKSDFNRNSNFYLDFFGEMKSKMNFEEGNLEEKTKKQEKINFESQKAPAFQKKLFQRFNKIRNLNKLKIDQNNRHLKSNPNIKLELKKPNFENLPVVKAFDKNKFKQILQEQEMNNEKENNNLESERNNSKKFRIVTKKAGNSKTKIKLIVE